MTTQTNKVQSGEVTAHAKDRGECRKGSTGPSSDHPCSYSKGYISEENILSHLKLAGKLQLALKPHTLFRLSPRLCLDTLTVNSSTDRSVLNLFHPYRFTLRLLCCTCFLSAQLPLHPSPWTLPRPSPTHTCGEIKYVGRLCQYPIRWDEPAQCSQQTIVCL